MQNVTLTNDFHNTSVNLRCEVRSNTSHTSTACLSFGQIKKAKKELCGVAGCCCSNDAGIRGRQALDGKTIEVNLDATYEINKPTPVGL